MKTRSGGLIGAVSGFGSAAFKAGSLLAKPEKWALHLVLFAGVITIFKKNMTPDLWSYAMWFGVALGLAALLYEMTASKGIVRAYWHGRLGSMVWSAVIWAVAFGFSINNWVGAATENQAEKSNLHMSAFIASDSVQKNVKDIERDLARLEAKHDWSKSVGTPDSYDDKIKAAEADAVYEATRNGCKSKCIAKQQLAANLKAERAIAIDRATTAEEIKAAKAKLEDARKVAMNTKVQNSEKRNDLVILTKYAAMSEESAQLFSGILSIVVVSVLLSFGSMQMELENLRSQGPRRPFEFFTRIYRAAYRALNGKEPPAKPATYISVQDPRGAEALSELQKLRNGIETASRDFVARQKMATA
jgi:hypothetical protein